ncbi:polysaccharide biosynthesis/export family protein [Microvirga puerhi]|uniref:Polysaccharide biosynthesis/export family protein n=1 Tax=Microvirga puerhi TaxID=2876078 RepID=A0ABS7VUZ4_9HYPH|nr:polysaccharide biosynthesis/export family protein [Microvirga puerhi]MBZ6079386.1 polysaccharide biosynthesis/export family protein [Microvirga puerhi]
MSKAHMFTQSVRSHVIASISIALAMAFVSPARADTHFLAPQTKIRVTVVQWIPSKGEYQQWGPISGEFTVSSVGTISLPLLGTISVTDTDDAGLATRIGEQLKDKAGLINAPSATVEILEYPPIYVVGSVTAPGEYKFRPGMTVLQALALGGGRYRGTTEGGDKGQIGMLGDLQTFREDILRTLARIARLQAESASAKEISFPVELTSSAADSSAQEVMAQEQIVFETRNNELKRQLDSLDELRNLFVSEIDILQKKTETLDNRIKLVSDELAGVRSLVERGIATVSRRSELELAVSNLQSNRLDEITATMRARQNLSEATRNALSLRDKHQTQVSVELQEAQANLERIKIKEDVIKKILVVSDAPLLGKRATENTVEPVLTFTIVRQIAEEAKEIAASEQTSLLPRDVVKVAISEPLKKQSSSTLMSRATQ